MSNATTIKPEIRITSFENTSVEKIINQIDQIQESFPPNQVILVTINSYGGSIYGLVELYSKFMSIPNPIVTYTTAHCMSAGAILFSTIGEQRYATPNSVFMIHEVQYGIGGDIKDVEDYQEFIKIENDKLMDILAKSMDLKGANAIRKLIKQKAKGNSLFLSAEDAKKINLVDKIAYINVHSTKQWNFVEIPIEDEVESKPKKKTKKKKSSKKKVNNG